MAALQVEQQRCVVIGGGTAALPKIRMLLDGGADVAVVAPRVTGEIRILADSNAIAWIARDYRQGDLAGAFVAINTVIDDSLQRAVWQEANDSRVLLNTMDRAELCHFIAPAVVQRGPLQIAISTSGESPFVASTLRGVLERLIGDEWGQLTSMIGSVRRRLRRRNVDIAAQTAAYKRLLRADVRELLREGDYAAAASVATSMTESEPRVEGEVSLVGAGPGDPRLLTLAAVDALCGADLVLHDALVDSRTLAFCGPAARIVDVGKRAGASSARQQDINAAMIAAARDGLSVVRLKGGDPFIFGRGGEELDALTAAGIPVTIVPGVTSSTAAPAIAGIPLTKRGVATSVAFVTGQDRGGGVNRQLQRIAAAVDTLVVLMPLGTLTAIVDAVTPAVGAHRAAALISAATTQRQRVVRAPLDGIVEAARAAGVQSPATLVIGEVTAPRELPLAAGANALPAAASASA
jgi:uroporphyrin-III C-methyltransferase/precorrin-2 dehydrogenase/sirohydrochlorin ferrochelatase